jgi:nicotinamidase-related amidase
MAPLRPRIEPCALIVVDAQPTLLQSIFEAEKLLARVEFIAKIAALLEIPVIASEQAPAKLGPLEPRIAPYVSGSPIAKTSFGCCESPEFMAELRRLPFSQLIVVGVETHICVSQTAIGLHDHGYEVAVCPDAVGSRTLEMHKLGMERIRDAGIAPIHTEGVAYEWLGSSEHPKFREALKLIKDAS